MAGIIVSRKLQIGEALDFIPKIEQWFKDNPRRIYCQTETFRIRRGFVGTDILNHTEKYL